MRKSFGRMIPSGNGVTTNSTVVSPSAFLPVTSKDPGGLHEATLPLSSPSILSNPLLKNLAAALSSTKHSASTKLPSSPSTEQQTTIPSSPTPNSSSSQPVLINTSPITQPHSAGVSPAPITLNQASLQFSARELVPSPCTSTRPVVRGEQRPRLEMDKRTHRAPYSPPVTTTVRQRKTQKEHSATITPPLPSSAVATSGNYVFDPVTNSWKQIAVSESTSTIQSDLQPSTAEQDQCPFISTAELASRFPILTKKDFIIIRELQRQVKLALCAETSAAAEGYQQQKYVEKPTWRPIPSYNPSIGRFGQSPSLVEYQPQLKEQDSIQVFQRQHHQQQQRLLFLQQQRRQLLQHRRPPPGHPLQLQQINGNRFTQLHSFTPSFNLGFLPSSQLDERASCTTDQHYLIHNQSYNY